ncbi:MAG: site-specific integrase, partial [Desulfobulbia bacterium]
MSPKTANKRLTAITTFFNWVLATHDDIERNPFDKIRIIFKSDIRRERKAFTIEELNTIFHSPIYTGCKTLKHWKQSGKIIPKESAKFWIPLIGLFSGMRLGEIVQLYKTDIKSEHGIVYFDIAPSAVNE